ncbi:hypothetical protein GCM10008098_03790 [Rhodanobacter panaciterrae]|uniref:Tetratricopeptide repeat protein n=1 Tax=Rhodanobacter panaciterrae TaxID=490572 RepID=A0ABQ2ZIA7_9GAMM|nr:tetratricopeptide repeat protein [Rhodanobacter panaciterrae]GGY15917.1 hypothetical protein GCM10008098_03790 [Rhodanobacter panaciterrae]
MSFRHPLLAILLLAGALLTLAAWSYAPGLHGGFLFDDFGNLPSLGASGPVDNLATFFRYITSGAADPTGRPLALLSFLLDARDWPAAPYPFKRTNLLLHLLNGVLLALLLRRLGRESLAPAEHDRNDLAAVLGTAFWLLHPLLVSTTLYIVQREAMLPTSFTLLGLLLWLRGRHAMLHGHPRRGLCWIAAGLGGCTILGVLSKANGALLPALALVIEYIWLQRPNPAMHELEPALSTAGSRQLPPAYRRSMQLLAGLPSLLLGAYLLHAGWSGFVHGVSALRPWTMGQRLLTEPRVLMDYLDLLWLPRSFTPGLFNDQVSASTSLWSPATTLPAVLAVLGLIVAAWCLRRKFPAVALAILFYFVGQAMESTTLQLELYFEHRNYLPAMLMFWPLALWLVGIHPLSRHIGPTRPPKAASNKPVSAALLKGALALVLLSGLALMTHASTVLWGNTHDQALLWARLNPGSPRAQANASLLEMAAGKPQAAVARLTAALPIDPDQVQLSFNLIGAHCMLGSVPASDLELARRAIFHTRDPGTLLVHWFDSSIEAATQSRCHGLDLTALDSLLDAGLDNPKLIEVNGRHQDLLYLKAHIALARHDPAAALHDFNAALAWDVRPGAALNQAALLGAAGYPQEGLAHLDRYRELQTQQAPPANGMPWLHAWVLQQQDYWPREIRRLRDTLRQDAQAKIATHE